MLRHLVPSTGANIARHWAHAALPRDMPLSQITKAFVRHSGERLHQGDIFRDLTIDLQKRADEGSTDIVVVEYLLPYCVLVTQDCDLEQDWVNRAEKRTIKRDKYLRHLLLLPAYPAEQLRTGTHIKDNPEDSAWVMETFNSEKWRLVISNQNARYHYIAGDSELQLPDLAVDFKHYTTIPRDQMYERAGELYRGTISALFREELSNRFAHYLSRIALPDLPLPTALGAAASAAPNSVPD